MKSRNILIVLLITGAAWHTASARPRKKLDVNPPGLESILASTNLESSVPSDLAAVQPEMPLGPQDVLKSYEIAMSMVVEKTAADFSLIVQSRTSNQITSEEAEYLLLQSYKIAMLQYQVLGALHDVLKRDIDETAGQQLRQASNITSSGTVLVVPFPDSAPTSR